MELNVTYKWLIIKNMFLIVDWIALGIKGGVDLFIYLFRDKRSTRQRQDASRPKEDAPRVRHTAM